MDEKQLQVLVNEQAKSLKTFRISTSSIGC